MLRFFLAASVFLVFTGCGKNEIGINGRVPGYQSGPITQAPLPSQPYNYPPQTSGYPPSAFSPQIPAGMPPQFYPWLPMYHYFYSQPQMSYVWGNIWSQWILYANNCSCGIYNFPMFWTVYFPVYWNYGPYIPFYNYMSASFYPWMISGVVLPPVIEPAFFWANYTGIGYGGFGFGGIGW
jgi:hypothetical protein